MPGLVDSVEGLSYAVGEGLIFEQGLGSPGLLNPPEAPANVFMGAGALRVTTTQRLAAVVSFAGAGGQAA